MQSGRSPNHNRIVLSIWLAILIALIALWWAAAPQQEKFPEIPKHPATPKPATQVAAPSSAVSQLETPNSKPETLAPSVSPKIAADPQADLSTALPDIVGLLQSGDLLGAYQRYMPPSYFASMPAPVKAQLPAQMQRMAADPNVRQHTQFMIQAFQAMQTQASTLNVTGDKATYTYPDPNGKPTSFIFQKIDGKWYVAPEMGTFF